MFSPALEVAQDVALERHRFFVFSVGVTVFFLASNRTQEDLGAELAVLQFAAVRINFRRFG